jgi:enoyl-CoA hydratase
VDLRRSDGDHAALTVSDPPHHRLDLAALDRLLALAHELEARPPASLVLQGGRKAFCVGVDPQVFVATHHPFRLEHDQGVLQVVGRFRALLRVLATLPCPTVAAVVGPALGGGFELALACDARVAAPTSTFALPEVRLGVLPGGGATQRLARLLGPAQAKDLVLTGRRISGEGAAALGLVQQVVDRDDVAPTASRVAVGLATSGRWRAARQNWK